MGFEVPEALVTSIQEGRCVAFVGAGLVQPLLPSWRELLRDLARHVHDDDLRAWLDAKELSSRDYEGIAQTIQKALGEDFERHLGAALDPRRRAGDPGFEALRRQVDDRLRWLRGIPFHSLLTTNFDTLIEGAPPCPATFAEVIGARRRPWWSHRAWASAGGDRSWQAPVVKLHGHVGAKDRHLVFTTQGYRRLVHENPGYRSFLRALFATHSVLYMGFSFSDGYINEIRSEILSWIDPGRASDRLRDYALLADVPGRVAAHLREHEGLECLTFTTNDRKDFSGFDAWLRAIPDRTSPQATLRRRVRARRILWLDQRPGNNLFGHEVLRGSAGGEGGAEAVDLVETVEQALARIDDAPRAYDLVISHFGYEPGQPPRLQRLVEGLHLRPEDRRAPVLVFSDPVHRSVNRPFALRLGVFDYVDDWPSLFEAIERVFDEGPRRHPSVAS